MKMPGSLFKKQENHVFLFSTVFLNLSWFLCYLTSSFLGKGGPSQTPQTLPLPNSCPASRGARVVTVTWQGQGGGGGAQAADNPSWGQQWEEAGLLGSKLLTHPSLSLWTAFTKHTLREKMIKNFKMATAESQMWAGREGGPSELALWECMSQMPMELALSPCHRQFWRVFLSWKSLCHKPV